MAKCKCLAILICFIPFSVMSAEISVYGFQDGFSLGKSNREVSIYLNGERVVDNKKLPITVQSQAKKTDITICEADTNYCDSASLNLDGTSSVDVGFFVQSLAGNLYFKVLTGGGLKVIKAKVAEQEFKNKELEEAKRNETRP